jgi:hypothetical protein
MLARNPFLLRDGYGPAADVARTIHKAVSTVHRMVEDKRCDGVRDGVALYIHLDSLISYFREAGNASLADEIVKLKAKYALEAGKTIRATDRKKAPKRAAGAR